MDLERNDRLEMNKEFIKWLKVNDYYNISINNRRYWSIHCKYNLYNKACKWRHATYYSNSNPSKYDNIKYIIQCILDL